MLLKTVKQILLDDDPNCQHEDYSIFRSWCLGNRCDDHAVKGYVKSIAEDGTIAVYNWNKHRKLAELDIPLKNLKN